MRLTLRTLLAYLDDILEPSHAKEIGKKISESTYASTLVERIRDVMRRRRLTAPQPLGGTAGLDANTVAEYLDNALTPEAVTDVEKVCLDSDVHLAEVAACHQILTLVLGEPVEVDRNSRERMYALGPVEEDQVVLPAAVPTPTPAPAQRANGTPTHQEPFAATVPDYLKRKPVWKRIAPYFLVTAVAGAWLALIMFDESFFPKKPTGDEQAVEDDDQDVAQSDTQKTDSPPAGNGPGTPATKLAQANVEPQRGDPIATPPVTEPGIDPDPPREEPGTGLAANDLNKPKLPDVGVNSDTNPTQEPTTPTTKPAEIPSAKTTETTETTAPTTPKPEESPGFRYDSPEGIALRFDRQLRDWYVVRRQSRIRPGDQLVVPEPFSAKFTDTEDRMDLGIIGGSRAEFMSSSNAAPIGLHVHEGYVMLSGHRSGQSNAAAAGDLVIAIAVRNELWRVELLTENTVCGIEVRPKQPSQPKQDLGADSYTSELFVLAGAVRFSDGKRLKVVGNGQRLSLSPIDRIGSEDEPSPATFVVQPITETPSWLDPSNSSSAIAKRVTALFESEFLDDEAISTYVPPLIRSPRPNTSELAVKCLVLVQDWTSVVEALQKAEHEEARLAAINGIRNWLPTSEKNDQRLLDELNRVFPPADVDVIHRSLWGYRQEDGRNETVSLKLVDLLLHEEIAIRELAFYFVQNISNRRLEYRPNQSAAQRMNHVYRLRGTVMRDGGLVTQ